MGEVDEMVDWLSSYTVHAIILFMKPSLCVELFKLLNRQNIDSSQFVWIASEISFTSDEHLLSHYPTGMLLYR